MKRNAMTIVIGAVLIVIFALLLFTFQVRQSEVAVVTTFGKPTRAIDQPNLYFKWPWPVQKVYPFDKRIQNSEDKFSEPLTADNITLLVNVYFGWRISDPLEFLNNFKGGSTNTAQLQLESIVRSAKNAVVGRHPLSDFVNANPEELQFARIENEIRQSVQSVLQTNNWGIQIEFLGIKKLGLPESVTQTVFERMKSERQILISKAQYEGEKEAQKIRANADREANETLANAWAEAKRIQGKGEAEAAKTLPVFQENPELANFLLRISALQQSLNQKTTLIFDQTTPPFDLFRNITTNAPAR